MTKEDVQKELIEIVLAHKYESELESVLNIVRTIKRVHPYVFEHIQAIHTDKKKLTSRGVKFPTVGKNKRVFGLWVPFFKEIWIDPSNKNRLHTFWHEVGHCIYQHYLTYEEKGKLLERFEMMVPTVTIFNSHELFSELFANRVYYSDKFPLADRFFTSM